MRHLLPIVLMMLMMTLGGCVQRRMQITSQPAGALVYLNDQEVGRTPLTHDFLWYGDYDVQVRKDGYQTLITHAKLVAPWWQWPPFDFVAELMPFRPTDERKLHFELQPITAEDTSADTLLERADEMRRQLQSPTTQP